MLHKHLSIFDAMNRFLHHESWFVGGSCCRNFRNSGLVLDGLLWIIQSGSQLLTLDDPGQMPKTTRLSRWDDPLFYDPSFNTSLQSFGVRAMARHSDD